MPICMVFSPPNGFSTDETHENVLAHGRGIPYGVD